MPFGMRVKGCLSGNKGGDGSKDALKQQVHKSAAYQVQSGRRLRNWRDDGTTSQGYDLLASLSSSTEVSIR